MEEAEKQSKLQEATEAAALVRCVEFLASTHEFFCQYRVGVFDMALSALARLEPTEDPYDAVHRASTASMLKLMSFVHHKHVEIMQQGVDAYADMEVERCAD